MLQVRTRLRFPLRHRPAAGVTGEVHPFSGPSSQMSISAVLEPDCDQDGLGDESQGIDTSSCTCKGRVATIVGTMAEDKLTGIPQPM